MRVFRLSARSALPIMQGRPHHDKSKKRLGFCLAAATPPTQPRKTPKATDLVVGRVEPLPPPDVVLTKLVLDHPMVMAIDVETHALVPRGSGQQSWWRTGRFGMQTTAGEDQLAALNVIQIGWTTGSLDEASPQTRSDFVRPVGFEIDAAATDKHGITQQHAEANGRDIALVLREVVDEAVRVDGLGGRICSHHLEFDAALLHNEMLARGLGDMAGVWAKIARKGLCTMDPDIGHWCRQQIGIGDKPRNIPMRLADLIKIMLPEMGRLLAEHHDAGNDSLMHWLLACDLLRRGAAA